MTTLQPLVPPELSAREKLVEICRKDFDAVATNSAFHFPKCPQGGTCECPNAKNALGLLRHDCDPNPKTLCIVRKLIFPNGTFS